MFTGARSKQYTSLHPSLNLFCSVILPPIFRSSEWSIFFRVHHQNSVFIMSTTVFTKQIASLCLDTHEVNPLPNYLRHTLILVQHLLLVFLRCVFSSGFSTAFLSVSLISMYSTCYVLHVLDVVNPIVTWLRIQIFNVWTIHFRSAFYHYLPLVQALGWATYSQIFSIQGYRKRWTGFETAIT